MNNCYCIIIVIVADIYSYGVVLWEMLHCLYNGVYTTPYNNIPFLEEVRVHIATGKTLKLPSQTPPNMRDLIHQVYPYTSCLSISLSISIYI